MPELPEVETVMRGLAPAMNGRHIIRTELRRNGLRFPFPAGFAAQLEGRQITSLSRRAKYILIDLDDANVLIAHLGMTGRFCIEHEAKARTPGEFYYEMPRLITHDHVVLHLDDGVSITYNDPRRFGFMDLVPRATLATSRHFAGMGPEPLGNDFDGTVLGAALIGRRTPIKAALLDQSVVAGLGNIYVCEALFESRINPTRRADSLSAADCELLAGHIRSILAKAVALGGSTLRDFAHTDGSAGAFQDDFSVYGREGEPCKSCGAPLLRMTQSGRSTFYCAACQR